MWKSWLLSSASSGVVAGIILGITMLESSWMQWVPVVAIFSSILGSLTQRYVLQHLFGVPLTSTRLTTIGWILCHAIAWVMMTNGVGFITILKSLAYRPTPLLDLTGLLTYIVVGTIIGLVLGGIQLLFWRRDLQPQVLWLGLSWLGWVTSAVLLAAAILLPYQLGQVQAGFPSWVTFLLTSLGIAIAWFAQSAIAGVVLVPTLRSR